MTRYGVDPVDEAIYDSVHDYIDPKTGGKGASALSKKIGRNLATFNKKADPFADTHLMNINDLRLIIKETKNYSILEALSAEFNHGIFLLSEPDCGTEKGILSAVLKAAAEGGEACKVIDDALSDDIITTKEAMICSKEINDQINALAALRERLVSMVVDSEHLPQSLQPSR